MTTRLLTGSKEEIVQKLARLEGQVREVIVFIEDPSATSAQQPVPATVEELFKEMEPYMVNVGDVDDSREAIYTRMEGE